MGRLVPADDLPAAKAPSRLVPPEDQPTPDEMPLGDAVSSVIGQGAWTLPALLGFKHANAQAFEQAIRNPMNDPRPFWTRYQEGVPGQQKADDAAVQRLGPWGSGIAKGLAMAPSLALVPQAAPEAGASLAARAGLGALNAGAQGSVVGLADSRENTVVGRIADAAKSAALAAPMGLLAPAPAAGTLSRAELDAAAGVKPAPSRSAQLAEDEAFKSAAGTSAKARRLEYSAENANRPNEIGRFVLDKGLISPTTQPKELHAASQSGLQRTIGALDSAAQQASERAAVPGTPNSSVGFSELMGNEGKQLLDSLAGDATKETTTTELGAGARLVTQHPGGQPLQGAAADKLHGDLLKIANKYTPRKQALADLRAIVRRYDPDGETGLADALEHEVNTGWFAGLSDLGGIVKKAVVSSKEELADAGMTGAERKALLSELQGAAKGYSNIRITPREAWEIRKQLDDSARGWAGTGDPSKSAITSYLNRLRGAVSERLGNAMEASGVGEQWRTANREFGLWSDLEDLTRRAVADEGNRRAGLLETIGLAGGGGASAAMALSHPVAALTTAAAGLAPHLLRKYGSQTAATMLDRTPGALQSLVPEGVDAIASGARRSLPVVSLPTYGEPLFTGLRAAASGSAPEDRAATGAPATGFYGQTKGRPDGGGSAQREPSTDVRGPQRPVPLETMASHVPAIAQAAQEGGKDAAAVAHHTAAQQSPQYRQIMRVVGSGKKEVK
jgi:hypothetical protein